MVWRPARYHCATSPLIFYEFFKVLYFFLCVCFLGPAIFGLLDAALEEGSCYDDDGVPLALTGKDEGTEIPWENCISMGSDNANVMTGATGGVIAYAQKKNSEVNFF